LSQYALAARLIFKIVYQNKNQKIIFANQNYSPQVKSWVYSCCRFLPRLQFILAKLSHKPFKKDMQQLEALLLLGLILCIEQQRPIPIIVSQIVDACVELDYPKCKSLVNAILRNFIRNKVSIFKCFDEAALYSHPGFLLNLIKKDWPDNWQNIIAANNSESMVHLRCRNLNNRDLLLKNMPLGSRASSLVGSGVILSSSDNLLELVKANKFCIQDAGAQVLVKYLPKNAKKILDAGAAPGGKTALLADFYNQASITAVDNSLARIKILEKNIAVWGLSNVQIMQQDLTKNLDCNDKFDLIVLDAPCTGSGVISRQPDIKNKINKKYVAQCVNKQRQMFVNLWPLVAQGGYFVYATCSILKKEGHLQIDFFKEKFRDLEIINVQDYTKYILPTEWNNGFYFCLLYKKKI
jgi:16S rRNA (cytosine967-C5)-methyltransferase